MPRDTRAAFLRKLDEISPSFRLAFEQAMADVRSAAQTHVLEDAIRRGDIEAAIRALQLGPEFFAPLDRVISETFFAGGVYALASLPKKPFATLRPGPLVIRFQGRHERAEKWIKRRSSDLIREINNTQREAIRTVIEAGLAEGRNPRQTALDIVGRIEGNERKGGIIGLTKKQAASIIAKRRAMIAEGMPKRQAEAEARDLMNKALLRRGETIARTETIHALNAGRYEGIHQLIDTGAVEPANVVLRWSATMDARTRDRHRAMHGQTVTFGTPFQSPTGALLRFPGDTMFGATAADVINCRCYAHMEIDFLAMAA